MTLGVGNRRSISLIDASKAREPTKRFVITAAGYGYERPDGVTVVPITALGP